MPRIASVIAVVSILAGCAGSPTGDATVVAAPALGTTDAPTLLIVHAPGLAEAAAQWARYRAAGGWRVVIEPYVSSSEPVVAPRLQTRIRELAVEHGSNGFSCLLLGDADAAGVPTWYFLQKDATMREPRGEPVYASDHPYQLLDDADEVPDFALGRVPARTNEEALGLLEKIRRYETRETLGPWRRQVAYVAGEGHYGAADRILESLFEQMVTQTVPDAYDVSLSYAKPTSIYCPPPSELSATVLDQLTSGCVIFNYVGHGSAQRFDDLHWGTRRIPILEARSIQRLGTRGKGRLTIALLTCCSAGWYDLPGGERSLAEEMLFQSSGPVAVIAGSRITHPYANAVLQKDVTTRLMSGRPATIGSLYLEATRDLLEQDSADDYLDALALPVALLQRWPSSLAELRLMHVRLYNLLGDPALRLDTPRDDVALRLEDGRVVGEVGAMRVGRVLVTLETARTDPAHPQELVAVTGADDPELESKAARNYAAANDRVLARSEGLVRDGRFEVPLAAVPGRAVVIKVYAWGTDASGAAVDSVGSLRIGSQSQLPSRTSKSTVLTWQSPSRSGAHVGGHGTEHDPHADSRSSRSAVPTVPSPLMSAPLWNR